jgi:hypothetical protein
VNKPEPTRELVIESSDSCERCLTLYAVSEAARCFLRQECEVFGILKPVDPNSAPPSILGMLVGRGQPPAQRAGPETLFTLHVWPNYDLQQVRTWMEAWPHISEPFEHAINEVTKEV